jgi:hypothetical protein
MQLTRVLPAVSVLSLISVEYGGWALLGFLTGRAQLGQFREQFFRAGRAHAGVLLVLSLVYFLHLDRTGYSDESSGSQAAFCSRGSWPSRVASLYTSGSGSPTEALWEQW